MKIFNFVLLVLLGVNFQQANARVSIFDNAHVYFGNGINNRTLNSRVDLPDKEKDFSKIILHVNLDCPQSKCDWWDRKAGLYILDEEGRQIELMRFMTPYRVGVNMEVDVTDLRPLLTGNQTFQVFIDTWVGPGHAQGNGWLVDAYLDFQEGRSLNKVAAVIPIFQPQSVVYGVESEAASLTNSILLDTDAKGVRLWSFISGHGQGNTENCAEFCSKNHRLTLGELSFDRVIWRDDCALTKTKGQQMGTYTHSRAGWCPGDKVEPWVTPILEVIGNTEIQVSWSPEEYINEKNTDYNGGSHTQPYYQISSLLIIYK